MNTTELSPQLLQAQSVVLAKLEDIKTALLSSDSMIGHHCEQIHRLLAEQEELVHILSPEQIRTFMMGMKKYKNIQLVAEATKKPGRGKVTADDL